MEPNEAATNRRKNGTFGPGNNANPAGRPKGQSLKEFWRQRFALMSDEEKLEFSQKVAPEVIYRMAEGNPAQGIGQDPNLDPFAPILVRFLEKDNG